MQEIFSYICQNAEYAPHIFLSLLFLAGLNIPISEDFLLLTAGALVSKCIPDQYYSLYFWMFLGCWLSGAQTYWIGRIFGPKLYRIRIFKKIITPERIAKLSSYYEKFGILTFILGRFIPGGVRNTLFITSGMGKMPFLTFFARDFIASLISTSVIFYFGFLFGENYELLSSTFIKYNRIALALLLVCLVIGYIRIKFRRTPKEAL